MRKLFAVVLCVVLAGVLGCTANLQTAVKSVEVAGIVHPYVFAEGRGVHGATLQVMDRYSPDGQTILAKDSAGSAGILSSFLHGGLAGAEMGAGIGAGLAAQGAANVVQNSMGGNSSAGATQRQVGINSQFQGQGQGQFQGQAQGQLLNNLNNLQQGQSNGALSPVTILP